MRESQTCHHRYVDCQENIAFREEDGITVYGGSASIQTCLNCNHSELPIETKETINPFIFENRKHSPTSIILSEFSRFEL